MPIRRELIPRFAGGTGEHMPEVPHTLVEREPYTAPSRNVAVALGGPVTVAGRVSRRADGSLSPQVLLWSPRRAILSVDEAENLAHALRLAEADAMGTLHGIAAQRAAGERP